MGCGASTPGGPAEADAPPASANTTVQALEPPEEGSGTGGAPAPADESEATHDQSKGSSIEGAGGDVEGGGGGGEGRGEIDSDPMPINAPDAPPAVPPAAPPAICGDLEIHDLDDTEPSPAPAGFAAAILSAPPLEPKSGSFGSKSALPPIGATPLPPVATENH